MTRALAAWLVLALLRPALAVGPPFSRGEGRRIVLVLTPGSQRWLRLPSLQTAAEGLGYRVVVAEGEASPPGYSADTGQLYLQVRLVPGPVGGDPRVLGWSHEEPIIDISLPRIHEITWRGLYRYWDSRGELPTEVYHNAFCRVLTFAIKHETFVHEIGQTLPSRARPYRMDAYAPNYLDSATLEDVFWDLPSRLRPDHPFLLDRARLQLR